MVKIRTLLIPEKSDIFPCVTGKPSTLKCVPFHSRTVHNYSALRCCIGPPTTKHLPRPLCTCKFAPCCSNTLTVRCYHQRSGLVLLNKESCSCGIYIALQFHCLVSTTYMHAYEMTQTYLLLYINMCSILQ